MGEIKIKNVQLSKQNVSTSEKVTIKVIAQYITQEPVNERLAFVLNGAKKPKP